MATHGLRAAGVALGAAAALHGGAALAWAYHGSARAQAPCPMGRTPLQVVREAATFDCTDTSSRRLRCAIVARYTLRNPTGAAQHVVLLVAPGSRARAVTAGGATARAVDDGSFRIEVDVPPEEEREVVLRDETRDEIEGSLRLSWINEPSTLTTDPVVILHPILAALQGREARVSVTYRRASHCRAGSERAWGAVGVTAVTVRAPEGWRPTQGWEQRGLCRGGDDGDLECRAMEGSPVTDSVDVSVEQTPAGSGAVRSGGLVIGLGGTAGQGFRARFGYDLALGRRVLGGLALDVGAAGNLVGAATLGVPILAPRRWRRFQTSFLPWALVPALGAPVGFLPDVRAGVRGQLSLVWIGLGLEVSADWWPVDHRVDVSVLLRIGI